MTNSAPVLPLEYAAGSETIWPCPECYPWHLEVVQRDGEVLIREWHAVDCPVFDDVDDQAGDPVGDQAPDGQ